MRRILTVRAGTTADEIKQRTGATSVELTAGGTVAVCELPEPFPETNVSILRSQVDDPASPILSSEPDGEVSCEGEGGNWYREGFRDALAAVEGFTTGFTRAMRESEGLAVSADAYADTDEWTWGLRAIGGDRLPREHGAGVKVAVLDTGLSNHTDLTGLADLVGRNFTDANHDTDWEDRHGHGTHVAGTIVGNASRGIREYGIATNAKLYVAKVLGDNGHGRMSSVILAIEWAIEQGCSVVNMSLSGGGTYPVLDVIGRNAMERGCLLVAAAGNEGRSGGTVRAPANASWIMAVGALDRALKPTAFSSSSGPDRASAVDISAPGSQVWSSSRSGGYSVMSGTSMAAPHVAGVAALWFERFKAEGMSPLIQAAMVWRTLLAMARPLPEPVASVGAGCVRVPS